MDPSSLSIVEATSWSSSAVTRFDYILVVSMAPYIHVRNRKLLTSWRSRVHPSQIVLVRLLAVKCLAEECGSSRYAVAKEFASFASRRYTNHSEPSL